MTALRWIGLAIVLASASVAAADPPCRPRARVTGEAVVVAAIEPLLRERGIELVASPTEEAAFVTGSCRHVTAEVMTGGSRIMVWIADAEDRRAHRMAEDAEAAATVIESWARKDLVDPLLAARGTIEVGGSGSATSARATMPASRTRPRYLLVGGGDIGVSGDRALWAGARAHGCGALGTFCIGGTLRYAIDTQRSGDTNELDTARTAVGLTLTGERPVRRGPFSISPGIGVGLTSVTATLASEDELEQASAIHARAGIAAAYEFAHTWSLRIDLEAEIAPFARERLGEADGVDRQLAGSPKLQTWFGIALAYGGP